TLCKLSQLDAGSPRCGSEAEDSLLEGGETSLEKSSSMGVVDSSNMASSEDVRTLACVLRSEVILIDEDDDDMSLRERTVTDCSVTDGNAAQLVCGRLLSVSSDSSPSVCERRSQSLAETPVPEQEEDCQCH
uniref:Si:ch211-12e13.12 n=1 Tax=Astyanax mexicanus TaxID=7994 RepID=A0A8B9HMN4_ASTMX